MCAASDDAPQFANEMRPAGIIIEVTATKMKLAFLFLAYIHVYVEDNNKLCD